MFQERDIKVAPQFGIGTAIKEGNVKRQTRLDFSIGKEPSHLKPDASLTRVAYCEAYEWSARVASSKGSFAVDVTHGGKKFRAD